MQPVTTQRVFSDRYELTHLVARGGMAQVYRARDRLLDRPVALKVLFPELSVDRAFVERFRREAQAAANLSHPNIVPVFDWGEDGGTYYIVMEYVDGQPLSQALRAAGPMPPDRVAYIAARVADALAYAHRHGVVHRDVKPGNVLLTSDDQVKVTDFGIARAINTEESLTQTGAVMGTATYFSPEQAEGHGVDARSDIYSLGVVMYEMIAGRPPFLGESPVAVASKHVRENPPVLRELAPAVPPALEAIVAKAMAKSADLRYQGASDLRADVQRFADGRPVTAADAATAAMLASDAAATGVTAASNSTQAVPAVDGRGAPRRERSRTGVWAALLVVLLAILGVVIYFVLQSYGYVGTTKFAMPTMANRPLATARSVLTARGLVVHVTGRRSTTSTSKTDVISTDPRPGAKVHKGEHVGLLVSNGPVPRAQLRTLKGESYSAAAAELTRLGLHARESLRASTKPSGTVLDQTPGPGSVKKGTIVTLVVSQQNEVPVPTVVGKNTATAGSRLGAAGLGVGNRTTGCSSQYGTGIVMGQSPKAGTKIAPHSKVTIQVSTGPCTVRVPTVVGDSETQAIATLSTAGLTAVPVTTSACPPPSTNRVMAQTPTGGRTVTSSSSVTIVLCRAQSTRTGTTRTTGRTGSTPTTGTTTTTSTPTAPVTSTGRGSKGGPPVSTTTTQPATGSGTGAGG